MDGNDEEFVDEGRAFTPTGVHRRERNGKAGGEGGAVRRRTVRMKAGAGWGAAR